MVLLNSCKIDQEKARPETAKIGVDKDASIRATKNNIIINDTTTHWINLADSIPCAIDDLFETITLPLTIDYNFLIDFDNSSEKSIVPFKCVGDGTIEKYHGQPTSLIYAYGRLKVNGSPDLYLVIKGMNPENPMDLFYISASIMTKEGDKLVNETMIAKYHAYSMIQEAYYCTIDVQGNINQTYTHTGTYEGKKDVFKKGDTTFSLVNSLFDKP